MEEHQKAWVLSFWQIVIERRPKLGEEVTVETFATGFDGLYGTRNFVMTDAKGSKIAYAYSIWVFMDLKKGRPVRPQLRKSQDMEQRNRFRWNMQEERSLCQKNESRASHFQ